MVFNIVVNNRTLVQMKAIYLHIMILVILFLNDYYIRLERKGGN